MLVLACSCGTVVVVWSPVVVSAVGVVASGVLTFVRLGVCLGVVTLGLASCGVVGSWPYPTLTPATMASNVVAVNNLQLENSIVIILPPCSVKALRLQFDDRKTRGDICS